ncbi:MAG: copper resistance protein NlpE N-terminal domain-containing protein [Clostridia bacterium]|nr:copper resistance protein NlpE N-terminal domain-containing protein [Clostridia bacterium]
MRSVKLKSSLLAALAALTLVLAPWKHSSLKDISKPYLGEYACRSLMLGETDYTEKFSKLTLELDSDGTFTLHVREKGGKEHRKKGKYRVDRKEELLWLYKNGGEKKCFPLKEGVVYVVIPLGKKTLRMEFEQKG